VAGLGVIVNTATALMKAAGNNRRGHRDATAIGDEEEEDADEPPQRQP
jgi:hypothetical protein